MHPASSLPAWLVLPQSEPQAASRLFCFPYAGGGISAYHSWMSEPLQGVETYFVQYPGRENRLREPPFTHIPALVEALTPAISPFLDRPFALFGHSLGALVAFELARHLRQHAHRLPVYFFASGCHAPQLSANRPAIHHLPQEELVAALRDLQGTPEAVLQNTELMEVLLPVLRADLAMFDTYTYTVATPLDCPILAFGGWQDKEVTPAELQEWCVQTTGSFSLQMLVGNHFFLQGGRKPLLNAISQALASC